MEALCELIVPGSSRVGPVVYVDAILTNMPPLVRDDALAAIDKLAPAAAEGPMRWPSTSSPRSSRWSARSRSRRSTATSSLPARTGPGAWTEIDFNSPLATRLSKDWSYLGVA